MVSRQREWQKRKASEGKCVVCGKQRNLYACYCDECQSRAIENQRKRMGHKPWKRGGVGRPPKTAKR